MSKSKFIRTLSESKNIFALEQKVIVLSFVKIVAFLLGYPVDLLNQTFLNMSTISTIFQALGTIEK